MTDVGRPGDSRGRDTDADHASGLKLKSQRVANRDELFAGRSKRITSSPVRAQVHRESSLFDR